MEFLVSPLAFQDPVYIQLSFLNFLAVLEEALEFQAVTDPFSPSKVAFYPFKTSTPKFTELKMNTSPPLMPQPKAVRG